MVSIHRIGNVVIYVYTNDHNPVHCHVYIGHETHLKVYLPKLDIEIVCGNIKSSEITVVKDLVWNHRNKIGKKWREYHGN